MYALGCVFQQRARSRLGRVRNVCLVSCRAPTNDTLEDPRHFYKKSLELIHPGDMNFGCLRSEDFIPHLSLYIERV